MNKINDEMTLREKLREVKQAQIEFSTYSQEKVDKIFKAVALTANNHRIDLAKRAVEETKMGVVEDKIIKNHYAAEYIYNAYKDTKTCGVLEQDDAMGKKVIAEPIGVVAAVIPTTNPTSTTIFKILISLKTRNGIIISPHPTAKESTVYTAKVLLEAAVKAGAPKNIIGFIEEPSIELTNLLMKEADITLATGGPSMVKAAYSSGKPALGVGAGNVPAVIDESADIRLAVNSIIHSKTFDNGMICSSEQSVIVHEKIYDKVKEEFSYRGAYILNKKETDKLRDVILISKNDKLVLNSKIVGQSAVNIAKMAGIKVPDDTKLLIGEVESTSRSEAFAHEKLSPVLAMYKFKTFEDACKKADVLVRDGGYGHTSSIYINEKTQKEKLAKYYELMKTSRIVVNTPSAQGGIGDIYNFSMSPSLTLGCGSWGGNSVSENVGVKHLLNVKTVVERRENMLWFRTPEKIYFKQGCLSTALNELKNVMNKKRVLVVTDNYLFTSGTYKKVTNLLDEMGIDNAVYFDVDPDPTIICAKKGVDFMKQFKPDTIIALGGGSAIDAAKIMWIMYENEKVDFMDMAMRFMDIRKRIYTFPKMGKKATFIAIPTSSGTGSEVTPFAVITDEETNTKYPIADYELMPDMAIIDTDFMMTQPKGLTAASGIDALTHALEAYASILASDYTDGLALKAIKNIFEYLPRAYENGEHDVEARVKMADSSTLAGMAFANAFLGICHSMAHKLGGYHHLPHGIANALLITEVMKFNSVDKPTKMGTFSQYAYPKTLERYVQIADYLGIQGKTDQDKFEKLLEKIEDLKAKVGVKKSIKDYEIKEEDFLSSLDKMVEDAFDDQCTGANPRYPLMEELKEIYLKVYYGKSKKK